LFFAELALDNFFNFLKTANTSNFFCEKSDFSPQSSSHPLNQDTQ
jgi:hypothetical protein